VRHSVEVTAESLYEAAILGVAHLRADGWAEQLSPGTPIEVQVRAPATTHCVSIVQLRRWVEAITPSPEEMSRKRKLRELLGAAVPTR
jgi:hypothetical protein